MIAQVAQGGGVALTPGKEVLVDAEHSGAGRRMPLAELAVEPVPEVALDRSRTDALPPAQAAAIDAIQVLLIDGLLERFAGALRAQDAGQALSGLADSLPAYTAPTLIGPG